MKILKKYILLLVVLCSLPFLFYFIKQTKVNISTIDIILRSLSFFSLMLFISYWIIALSDKVKWLSVYDTSIYIYIYTYTYYLLLKNIEYTWGTVIFMVALNITLLTQSILELSIIIDQQLIKKYSKLNRNNKNNM